MFIIYLLILDSLTAVRFEKFCGCGEIGSNSLVALNLLDYTQRISQLLFRLSASKRMEGCRAHVPDLLDRSGAERAVDCAPSHVD